MLGVLSTLNGYYGSFGAHHTAEDNLDGLRTYDPGMRQAVVTAQVTGIQAMRAANATVEPLRIEEIPGLKVSTASGPTSSCAVGWMRSRSIATGSMRNIARHNTADTRRSGFAK
jgi:hypothetical protein